jgi:DNA-binding response OmpR family regulator
MRLLLVEDDLLLGAALKKGLELAGYGVDWLTRGDDLPAADPSSKYAVVLLDLGLPHMSGIDALKLLRSRHDTIPVIIITAQDRPDQKVQGLDAGADDFLVKPLDLDELLARIRAQIRRRDNRSSDIVSAGCISLDLTGHCVRKDDESISVTAREFRLLALMMRRAGRFVSKADIEANLYDDETGIESNTVEVAISALRRKLGRDTIITARGIGYMIPK